MSRTDTFNSVARVQKEIEQAAETFFEPKLRALGLAVDQIEQQDVERLEGSLARINEAMQHPVQLAQRQPAGSAAGSLPDGLTVREAEVLAYISRGLSNQEIAASLFVSEATVKTHINRIFAKTQSRDRAQAIAYAHHHGLT